MTPPPGRQAEKTPANSTGVTDFYSRSALTAAGRPVTHWCRGRHETGDNTCEVVRWIGRCYCCTPPPPGGSQPLSHTRTLSLTLSHSFSLFHSLRTLTTGLTPTPRKGKGNPSRDCFKTRTRDSSLTGTTTFLANTYNFITEPG